MKKNDHRIQRSLFSPGQFFIFFGLAAFTVTCCFLLFFSGADIPDSIFRERAGLVFGNVLLLSAIFTLIDAVRRYYTVKRPIQYILDVASQIRQGDFSARIPALHIPGHLNEFDAIIEDLNKMAEELSGIETLRTDFVANVSHELKTPLAVIQNYSTMLQNPGLSEEKRIEYAKNLVSAASRLSDLITNILKLNKLENQQIYPSASRYDLSEQLCECLIGFESVWENKDLELDTDIDPDIFIEADQELMTLVWNNLFSNAMKFTDAGGKVSVSLKTEQGLNEEQDYAVVKVTDTGCGISPKVGAHIFEKFYQGDKSHATQGNGLGLALVKRVVDIVKGEIAVESIPGKGSTFTVRLKINSWD